VKRREFLGRLAVVAAAWPIAASAQQPKLPRVGVLVLANQEPFWSELRAGLRGHGYIEGQNIAFEFRFADGSHDRLRELAAELVRLRVDIIVAHFTPAVTAAKEATSDIPIVMAWAGDPIGTGLISSLARPGGNITGLSGGGGLSGKSLDLIRDVLPDARRITALAHAPDPFSIPFIKQVEEAGRMAGISIQTINVRGAEDLESAFAAMIRERTDAIVAQPSLPRKPVIELALKHRLPLFGAIALFAYEGGLMSYSINQKEMYRRAAYYVDRILKGAKPADLPVEQPTRFELVVNLKTAKALGLTIPAILLARADEVIE
jgi:putative tryptophan/tyrosine transport system substrate-binding protein